MINTVLRLYFDQSPGSAVIKLNQPGISFSGEAHALEYLSAYTAFPSPKVYACDPDAALLPYSYLLLEDLKGVSLVDADITRQDLERLDQQLAEALLELHSHKRTTYGGIHDLPGSNRWLDVFLPRLQSVRSEKQVSVRLSPDVLKDVDNAIDRIESVFVEREAHPEAKPVLVHGDIWAGNLIVKRFNDRWMLSGIVDPALEYADVEYELAYLESFNNPRPIFFQHYTQKQPLQPGYELRRLFYWLNTYLIHVWLFGDRHYCELASETARAIRDLK